MSTTKVKFLSAGGETLSGVLDAPSGLTPHNYVVFAHCFTCTKNLNAIRHISAALIANGFAVLKFDFTGLGDSEGEFSQTSFTSNVSDLVNAAEFLADQYRPPSLLIGHSLGGTAVLAAAVEIPSIKAVATIGAPFAPEHVEHLLDGTADQFEQTGQAKVNIGGRPFIIGKQFIDDIRAQDPLQTVRHLKRALMILHSPQDTIVGIDNAASIYQAAKHPKSFISLDGADHLLSQSEDAIYAGNTIAAWASRYIDIVEEQVLQTDEEVVVRLDSEAGYTTFMQAGKHKLLADEPVKVGGADLGPSPYGYLLAGLGACTAMTLKMYARRKKWNLQSVDVHLSHSKIHADDCACDLSGDDKGRLDKINRLIDVRGDLDDQQIKRLLQIADRCPVHKTLESEVLVTTGLLAE